MMGIFATFLGFLFPAAVAVKGNTMTQPFSQDVDILARTIWGEARSEGFRGMQAVANVIVNRHKYVATHPQYGIRWGFTWQGICQKSSQFSVWNSNDANYPLIKKVTQSNAEFRMAFDIAQLAIAGKLVDIVAGSTYYHTRTIEPTWARGATPVARVGSHVFYQVTQIA